MKYDMSHYHYKTPKQHSMPEIKIIKKYKQEHYTRIVTLPA